MDEKEARERGDAAGKNSVKWLVTNKAKLLAVGFVVLSLSNRSLRKDNAKLLVEVATLRNKNIGMIEALESVKWVSGQNWDNLFDFYFGNKSA